MRRAGARGVRTSTAALRAPLLQAADSLGLRLYVDLSVALLPASALRDTIGYARRQLDAVLRQARRHPAIRAVGLARSVDTSDPRTCTYFETLAARVQTAAPDVATYYVTPFGPAHDRCGAAVDKVVLDLRDADQPEARLRTWREEQPDLQVGIAALGTWVDDGRQGLRQPHAPEQQARYLEHHLRHLLDRGDTEAASPAFVYRWRDAPEAARRLDRAMGRSYGVHAASGRPRPAARVVHGLFQGTQTAFAFPQGTPPAPGWPWLVVLTWSIVGGLGTAYASVPSFQRHLRRYFQQHGFYRDAVREGRETLPVVSWVLVITAALAAGMVATECAQQLRPQSGVALAVEALPPAVRQAVAGALAAPWALGGAVAAGTLLTTLMWAGALQLVSRWQEALSGDQVFMLVAWPSWPAVLVIVAVAAWTSAEQAPSETAAALLAVVSLSTAAAATARTLVDYQAVARVPAYQMLPLSLVSPLGVLALLVLFAGLHYDVDVAFVWRLLART
jgi:hypothetical protein